MAYTTINKSTEYFTTNLWTGAGATSKTISGNSFQPDWVWVKRRSATGSHKLYDAVRGTTKDLSSDNANPETTASGSGYLNAFNSDGFTLVQGSSDNYYVDANGVTYVAWNWRAGGGQGTSNTDGSINTTYTSVNTTAGFSISSYTGTGSNATVGHGLGAVPKMIILKELNPASTRFWRVYHEGMGNSNVMYLDQTSAQASDSAAFNSTSPTNSVFSLGTSVGVNESGKNFIAYCFAEKTGFSKFGSYIGNGYANGTFVYTGFKPAFVINKRIDSTGNWMLIDNKRLGYNPAQRDLRPNLNNAEGNDETFDFLSNGFKVRTTSNDFGGGSGATYIFMAFAEEPLVGTNNVPATAR